MVRSVPPSAWGAELYDFYILGVALVLVGIFFVIVARLLP
jgi:hypothetical protein